MKNRKTKSFNSDRKDYSRFNALSYCFSNHIKTCQAEGVVRSYEPTRTYTWQVIQKQTMGFSRHMVSNKFFPKRHKSKSSYSRELSKACYVPVGGNHGMELLGKYPIKTGKRPSTVFGPTYEDVVFWKNADYVGRHTVDDIEEQVCVGGGFSGSLPHFRAFSRENNWKFKSLNRCKNKLKQAIDKMPTCDTLRNPCKAAIWYMPIRPNANPGGETGFLYRTKKDAWSTACKTASILYDKVIKKPTENWSIYSLGDRAKRNKGKVPGDNLECRLVMMQDMVEYALARPYTYLIEKHLAHMGKTPIVLSKTNAYQGYHEITSNDKIYPFSIEIDWTFFDSSQRADIIIAAFGFVRGMFEESKELDNLFTYFCDGLLNKQVLQSDSNLFFVKQGLPSGTVWTSIINSVANAILCEFICSSYPAFKNTEYTYDVSGDDGKIFFMNEVKFDKDNLISWVKKKFNMEIKIEMSGPPINEDPDKSVSFLKTCLYWGKDENGNDVAIPTTPPKSIKTRLSCPQTKVSTYAEKMNFIFSQSQTFVNHEESINLVAKYLSWSKIIEGGHSKDKFGEFTNEIRNYIHLFNEQTYFSVRPEIVYGKISATMGDRVVPILNDEYKINWDTGFVENWLKDNTRPFARKRLDSKSRWYYIRYLTGTVYSIASFLKELPRRYSKFLKQFGIDPKLVSKIKRFFTKYKRIETKYNIPI